MNKKTLKVKSILAWFTKYYVSAFLELEVHVNSLKFFKFTFLAAETKVWAYRFFVYLFGNIDSDFK